jgi:hypothetical protein
MGNLSYQSYQKAVLQSAIVLLLSFAKLNSVGEAIVNLRREDPDRVLYLAVPLFTFNTFFQLDFPRMIVERKSA